MALDELSRDTVVPLHPGAEMVYRRLGRMLGTVSQGRLNEVIRLARNREEVR